MNDVTIQDGLLITPLGQINLWRFYYDLNDLLTEPNTPARDFRELRAVTRDELVKLLEGQGIKNTLEQQVIMDELARNKFLEECGRDYRVTEQGVALYHALSARI